MPTLAWFLQRGSSVRDAADTAGMAASGHTKTPLAPVPYVQRQQGGLLPGSPRQQPPGGVRGRAPAANVGVRARQDAARRRLRRGVRGRASL